MSKSSIEKKKRRQKRVEEKRQIEELMNTSMTLSQKGKELILTINKTIEILLDTDDEKYRESIEIIDNYSNFLEDGEPSEELEEALIYSTQKERDYLIKEGIINNDVTLESIIIAKAVARTVAANQNTTHFLRDGLVLPKTTSQNTEANLV